MPQALACAPPPQLSKLEVSVAITQAEWHSAHVKGLLPCLSKLTALKELSLLLPAEGSTRVMVPNSKFYWDLSPLTALRSLQHLKLHDMPVSGLSDVLSEVRLPHLSVSGVSLEGWPSLESPHLRTLSVSGPLTHVIWLVWSAFACLERVAMEGCVCPVVMRGVTGPEAPDLTEMMYQFSHDGDVVEDVVLKQLWPQCSQKCPCAGQWVLA